MYVVFDNVLTKILEKAPAMFEKKKKNPGNK